MNFLIASNKYKDLRYPKNHPLRVPRVSLMLDYIKALRFEIDYVEGQNASLEDLLLFHTKDYVEVLIKADQMMKFDSNIKEVYNIGTIENPVSAGMWKGSLLATGSSVQAADIFIKNYKSTKDLVVFNPAGGMHHARSSKANGFCFLNDPVITIKYLQKYGFEKILYIDLDAHHPDGVQEIFYEDDSVFTLSLHQSPEYAFPFNTGYENELGNGKGLGFNMNIPFSKDINDDEFIYALESALDMVLKKFNPDVFVVQMGVDGLKEDYLSKFNLSNNVYLKAIDIIRRYTPKFVLLGGGGYNPVTLARAWALVWLYIEGIDPRSITVTEEATKVLKSVDYYDFDELMEESVYYTISDERRGGNIRIKEYLEKIFSLHKFNI